VGIALVLLLSTVSFVSLKGSRVLMTLYAVELGAGPFEAGMLFAVYGLIPALFVVHAGRIAERILTRIRTLTIPTDEESAVQCSVSIGIAEYDENGDVDAKHLMRRADEQLYRAKRTGKNRIAFQS
jgi:GGDEF domain-containing protein